MRPRSRASDLALGSRASSDLAGELGGVADVRAGREGEQPVLGVLGDVEALDEGKGMMNSVYTA